MSNGSTGSPKLKWLKAFKSLKTSSPTTPPLSDKWATYFLSTKYQFPPRACREKRRQSFRRDGDGFLHRATPGTIFSLYMYSSIQVPEMKEDHFCFSSKFGIDCLIRVSLCWTLFRDAQVENSAAGCIRGIRKFEITSKREIKTCGKHENVKLDIPLRREVLFKIMYSNFSSSLSRSVHV